MSGGIVEPTEDDTRVAVEIAQWAEKRHGLHSHRVLAAYRVKCEEAAVARVFQHFGALSLLLRTVADQLDVLVAQAREEASK